MNPIIQNYIEVLNEERELEVLVEVTQEKLRKHREKIGSWIDSVIVPIAKELCKHTGHPHYEIYGPFGLKARTTIYLMDNGEKNIVKNPSWFLTVIPYINYNLNERKFFLKYETEKIIEEYPRGSIGWMNDMGREELDLPDTIEEIAKLLRYSEGEKV